MDYIPDAEWWIARSDRSVPQLLKAFRQQEVPCLLYERVGEIVPRGKCGKQHRVGIQLVRTGKDWDLDLCLSDVGVYLEGLWNDGNRETGVT